jgi:hypothetical protein
MTRARFSVVLTLCLAFAGSAAALAFAQTQTPTPAAAAQASLPPAEEILKKYREAIGGEEAIRSHTVRSVSGTFEIPAQGMRGELVVLAAAPDRMRLTITLPGLGEMQRGFDGKVGWSVDPAIGPRLLDGRELDELKHSADFYDDLHDASKYSSVTVVGKTMFEGQECYEVKLVRASGFEYTEFFSLSTGLLAGVKMNASSQLGSVPVTTAVSEYKPFGGVLAPTITRQRMMGLESVTTITAVSYDAIDPKTFELPASIAALAAQKK